MSSNQNRNEVQDSLTNDLDKILEFLSDSGDSSDSAIPVPDRLDVFTGKGLLRVHDWSAEHHLVANAFLAGMGLATGEHTDIVAIHRNVGSDPVQKARLSTFKIFAQALSEKRGGNPNIQSTWYGGSRDELCEILVRGFSRRSEPSPFERTCGLGIHPYHLESSGFCTWSSPMDENGLRHMLLCQLIVGKLEMVAPGSNQSHPSSDGVDTGVDNLLNPIRYTVWDSCMNSHIYPAYLITFIPPPTPNMVLTVTGTQLEWMRAHLVRPKSSVLSQLLPPQKIQLVIQCQRKYAARKITGPQLRLRLRFIIGDRLIAAMVRFHRINKAIN